MIYAIAILAIAGGFGLWLWRKGKKEAYGEAAQETIKAARKAASVDSDIGHAADDDVFKQLRDKWTKE
jgi:hypothetical protein